MIGKIVQKQNYNVFGKMLGFAQIPLMIGLLIMAVAVPAGTKLVQQTQDKRSSANDGSEVAKLQVTEDVSTNAIPGLPAVCSTNTTRYMYKNSSCVSGPVMSCSSCGGAYTCYTTLEGCTGAHPVATPTKPAATPTKYVDPYDCRIRPGLCNSTTQVCNSSGACVTTSCKSSTGTTITSGAIFCDNNYTTVKKCSSGTVVPVATCSSTQKCVANGWTASCQTTLTLCTDGTTSGNCSKTAGMYCSGTTLSFNPTKCPCPSGTVAGSGKCDTITDNYDCRIKPSLCNSTTQICNSSGSCVNAVKPTFTIGKSIDGTSAALAIVGTNIHHAAVMKGTSFVGNMSKTSSGFAYTLSNLVKGTTTTYTVSACSIDTNNTTYNNSCPANSKTEHTIEIKIENDVVVTPPVSGCTSDLSCPANQICTSGKCVASYNGYPCSRDTQCPVTSKCINGKCAVATTAAPVIKTFSVSPTTGLKVGDVITVTASLTGSDHSALSENGVFVPNSTQNGNTYSFKHTLSKSGFVDLSFKSCSVPGTSCPASSLVEKATQLQIAAVADVCKSAETRFMFKNNACVSGPVAECESCTGGKYKCYTSLAGCVGANPTAEITCTDKAGKCSSNYGCKRVVGSYIGIGDCDHPKDGTVKYEVVAESVCPRLGETTTTPSVPVSPVKSPIDKGPAMMTQLAVTYDNSACSSTTGIYNISKFEIVGANIFKYGLDYKINSGIDGNISLELYVNKNDVTAAFKKMIKSGEFSTSVGEHELEMYSPYIAPDSAKNAEWKLVMKDPKGAVVAEKIFILNIADDKKCTPCSQDIDRRKNGDGNCDGKTTLGDLALWREEFILGKGEEVKNIWNSDYNCDGKVTVTDRTVWLENFIKSFRI